MVIYISPIFTLLRRDKRKKIVAGTVTGGQ